LTELSATFLAVARYRQHLPGNVMRNGGTVDIDNLVNRKTDDRKICGAMAEQRRRDGHDDNESVPQQFVHLVGCRDPNTCRAPSVLPGPLSSKP
jgi:hypothetical protein